MAHWSYREHIVDTFFHWRGCRNFLVVRLMLLSLFFQHQSNGISGPPIRRTRVEVLRYMCIPPRWGIEEFLDILHAPFIRSW